MSAQSHYLAFPESYDGSEPYPVLIGFHGCGGVNRGTSADDTEWMRLTEASAFASDYVRAVPLSADGGGCWSYDTDIARIKAMYDELLESYCVDTSRVFATGHSSGAQMIVQILLQSHVGDAEHLGFAAVAPTPRYRESCFASTTSGLGDADRSSAIASITAGVRVP